MGGFRSVIDRASKQYIPLSILFEVTHRCNLGCVHCYLPEGPWGRPKSSREELTLDEIGPIFDQLVEAGCLFITLSGGEVFMRRDFLEIVRAARDRGFVVAVFTTGTLLNAERAQQLADCDVYKVELSVYSANSDVHDRVTQIPGSHWRTLEAIRLLSARGVRLVLKMPLMVHNQDEYEGLIALAEKFGADFIVDPTIVPRRDGNPEPVQLAADRAKLLKFFSHPKIMQLYAQPVICTPQGGQEVCATGRRTCMINPYGDLFPCPTFPTPIGNLREQTFHELWTNSPVLHRLRSYTHKDLKPSENPHHAQDGLQCGALAMYEDGDFLNPFSRGVELALIRDEAAQWAVSSAP